MKTKQDNPFAEFRQNHGKSAKLSVKTVAEKQPVKRVPQNEHSANSLSELLPEHFISHQHHLHRGSNLPSLKRAMSAFLGMTLLLSLVVQTKIVLLLILYIMGMTIVALIFIVHLFIFHHRTLVVLHLQPIKPKLNPRIQSVLSLIPGINVGLFLWTCINYVPSWRKIVKYYDLRNAPVLSQGKFTANAIFSFIPVIGSFISLFITASIYSDISKVLDYLQEQVE